MKKITILTKGQKFTANGGSRFAKDVLRVGRWVHPRTGEEVNFDGPRLDRLAAATDLMISRQFKVPFPDGHSFSALDNMGEWPGPFTRFGQDMIGVVDVKDPKAKAKIESGAMDAVSVCIEFDYMDSKGNKYPEVITHICATDYPVVNGQKEFVALSSGAEDVELYVPETLSAEAKKKDAVSNSATGTQFGSIQMNLAKLAQILGLAADTAPEKIVEEAEKKFGTLSAAVKASETQSAALSAELASHGFKLEAGKVVKLDVAPETDREKKLIEDLKEVKSEQAKAALSAARAKADELVKSGKVPPAMQDRLARVLAVTGKVEALSMSSSNPKEVVREVIDLSSEIGTLFASVPGIMKGLQQLSGVEVEAEKKKAEELATKSHSIATRLQPHLKK